MTHEPLVSSDLFAAAAAQRLTGEHRKVIVKPRRQRTYCLSSLVHCGDCGRRMIGAWSHEQAYYRCTFPSEYAGASRKHERGVYLREADITAALDGWLLSVFDPENLDGAVAALTAAQTPDEASVARRQAARRRITECDRRLTKLRSALEAEDGPPPAVVAGWLREVEAERLAAERELAATKPNNPLSEAEIRALVGSQRHVLQALGNATPNSVQSYTHTRWAFGSLITPSVAHLRSRRAPCVLGVCRRKQPQEAIEQALRQRAWSKAQGRVLRCVSESRRPRLRLVSRPVGQARLDPDAGTSG